ncbi:MAG: hypothetical protein Q9180_006217, partial [Flavoplaca navasiana]
KNQPSQSRRSNTQKHSRSQRRNKRDQDENIDPRLLTSGSEDESQSGDEESQKEKAVRGVGQYDTETGSEDEIQTPGNYRIVSSVVRPYNSQKRPIAKPSYISSRSNGQGQGRLQTPSRPEVVLEEDDDVALLWNGTLRRPRFQSSPSHAPVIQSAIQVLQATVFVEATLDPRGGGLWPETFKAHLSNVIGRVWQETTERLSKTPNSTSDTVLPAPTPNEARKMLDAIGNFRAHGTERVRRLVESFYDFGKDEDDHRPLVDRLLESDNFLNENLDAIHQTEERRFLAPILPKAIFAVFFQNDRHGLGLCGATKHMFKAISPGAIVTVGTFIRHALSEWVHGERRTIKFEGIEIRNTFKRISTNWHNQSKERQRVILDEVTYRTHRARGVMPGDCTDSSKPVRNACENDIDDLQDIIAKQNIRKYGKPTAPPSYSGHSSQGTDPGAMADHSQIAVAPTSPIRDSPTLVNVPALAKSNDSILPRTSRRGGYTVTIQGEPEPLLLANNLSFDDFCATLGRTGEQRIWYRTPSKSWAIIDDVDNYAKFVAHAVEQKQVEIILGGEDDWRSS